MYHKFYKAVYLKINDFYNTIYKLFITSEAPPITVKKVAISKKQMNIKGSIDTKYIFDEDYKIYKGSLTNIERKIKIDNYRQQLQKLKELPIIKQRTDEWYSARKLRLTASDLDEAISNSNIRLAKKKAGVIIDNTNYTGIPALKWGTMFEPMATRCYSQKHNDILMHEFGLLLDSELEHFGASPDGINDMGIMVEIKCPYSREIIDNTIPYKYYMQIQGQLAVCKLQECDYIECDFMTFENVFIYIDEMFNTYQNPNVNHGIIAEFKHRATEEYTYLYSDIYLTASDAHNNIKTLITDFEDHSNGEYIFMKLTPWRLKNMNVQRVTFDERLWALTIPKIEAFWNKVEECKKLPIEETPQKVKITFIEDS
jgi:putative phage-type endonuclease